LSVADNANLRFGTNAFTIQAWVYRNASGAAHSIIAKGGASTGYVLQVTSTNVLRFTHGTTNVDTTTTIPASAWTHVAAVRTNTSTNGFQLYINGVSSATATVATDFNQTDTLYIGSDRSAANVMNGYISGLKYTNGTAESISVPTEPPTATTNVALLTNFTNAGIYDATSKNDLETVGNAQISTAISAKWGSGSMLFNGTTDYLKSPASSVYSFGTGDWTIEFWYYQTAVTGTPRAFSINGIECPITTAGIGLYDASAALIAITGSSSLNTWSYYCACRVSGTIRLFKDGNLVGSVANSTNYNSLSYATSVGAKYNGADFFQGYLNDIRTSRYGRYVEGTGGNAGKMVFNGTNNLALPTSAFPTL
jgi:hypothetical protein